VDDHFTRQYRDQSWRDAFKLLDLDSLRKKSDQDFALWHSSLEGGSPQEIWANFEWQRRLNRGQERWMKVAVWVGLAGVLLGAALGALIPILAQHYAAVSHSEPGKQAPEQNLKAPPQPVVQNPPVAPKAQP
jgi:hypothetical protein